MSYIEWPDVPEAPGVPKVPRDPEAQASPILNLALNVGLSTLGKVLGSGDQWGVYRSNGEQFGIPSSGSGLGSIVFGAALNTLGLYTLGFGSQNSTKTIHINRSCKISDFPIEGGTFSSYNKAIIPTTVAITMIFTGDKSAKIEFLGQLSRALDGTELFIIRTPYIKAMDFCFESWNLEQSADSGANMLIVEAVLRKVRQVTPAVVKPEASNAAAKNPMNIKSIANGLVQTVQKSIISTVKDKAIGFIKNIFK